jgi:peptidoglycan/xylan/chitin deacetylase (PgdA/CDA1 family)
MRHLAKYYHVLSMEEVFRVVENGARIPDRAVLITFDDAYLDFGEIAWPILKHYRLPATLFVPTAYPDQPQRAFWWDRLYRAIAHTSRRELTSTPFGVISLRMPEQRRQVLRRLQNYVKTIPHTQAMVLIDAVCHELGETPKPWKTVLSWDELRQLSKDGVTIGAHTQTHPIMTRISVEEAYTEITGALQDLQQQLGQVPPIFSYPDGGYNETVVNLLRQHGIVMAFTMRRGFNELGSIDLYRLRRNNIGRGTSLSLFCLRLLPLFTRFDTWWHRKLPTQIPA